MESSCQEIREKVNKHFDWKGVGTRDAKMLKQTKSLLKRLPLYLQAQVIDESDNEED